MFKYIDDLDGTHTPAGEFTDGDHQLGIARTIMLSKWPNMIQRELLGLVQGAGLAPDQSAFDQVLKAVQKIADERIPVGGTLIGPYATPMPNFAAMEGQLLVRADFPELWAHAQTHAALVSDIDWQYSKWGAYSTGDGSTTFRLPDPRGSHIRIWDNGKGLDAGRDLATYDADAVGEHTHDGNGGSFFNYSSSGAFLDAGNDARFSTRSKTGGVSGGAGENKVKTIAWRVLVRVK